MDNQPSKNPGVQPPAQPPKEGSRKKSENEHDGDTTSVTSSDDETPMEEALEELPVAESSGVSPDKSTYTSKFAKGLDSDREKQASESTKLKKKKGTGSRFPTKSPKKLEKQAMENAKRNNERKMLSELIDAFNSLGQGQTDSFVRIETRIVHLAREIINFMGDEFKILRKENKVLADRNTVLADKIDKVETAVGNLARSMKEHTYIIDPKSTWVKKPRPFLNNVQT